MSMRVQAYERVSNIASNNSYKLRYKQHTSHCYSPRALRSTPVCLAQTPSLPTGRLLHPPTKHRLYSFTAPCLIHTPPFCAYLVQLGIEQVRTRAPWRAQTPWFMTRLGQEGCEHCGLRYFFFLESWRVREAVEAIGGGGSSFNSTHCCSC